MGRAPARHSAALRRAHNLAPSSAPVSGAPSRARVAWLALALVAVTIAVFAPVWTFDFVSYDDPWYVSENPNIVGGLSWQSLRWALTTGYLFYWHPATWLSHLVDVELFGLRAGGHHATSLLLHILSTVVLFGFLRRTTGTLWRSAFVAALFAVHPLHVESVAWIAERKDVLSTFCLMLTLWAYAWYVEKRSAGRYVAVLGCYTAGLMAKPMLVMLPAVLLLLDIWPFRRVIWPRGRREAQAGGAPVRQGAVALRLLVEKLPLVVLAIAVSVATVLVQSRVGAVGTLSDLSLDYRLTNALLGYVRYAWQMLWPAGLAIFYPYPPALPPWWQTAGAAALLSAVTVAVVRMGASRPVYLVGWLWYLVTLLPVIGLLQAGDQLMADRFTYVPLVGLFLIVAWAGAELAALHKHWRAAVAAAALLAVCGSAAVAHAQVQHWRNSETVWRRALAVTTQNHRAHAGLADVLARQGRTDEAIAEYREALRILPAQAEWRNSLGVLYVKKGMVMEAMGQFAIATRLQPGLADAHNNLGAMLARAGRTKEAIAAYEQAIRLRPSNGLAHHNRSLALTQEGRLDEALRESLEALKLEPSNADWHYQAAAVYGRLGKRAEARMYLEKTLALDPRHEAARRALEDLNRQGE